MVVQDPPMTILTDVGEDCKYDKSKFREYTKTGPFIDYIVWPAVLIQEGGNMMAKGVAQCRCRVAEVHDEYQRDRVETDEEKSTQEEKFVCDTDTSGKDFQTTPVNTDGVELQFEPNKSQEIAIQTTETENGLPVIDVNTENAKDESGNHGSDQTESVEQVGVASYTDDKKDSQFQLGEKQSEFLLSSNKGNHTIKDIKNKVNNSIPETNEASKNEDFNATQNDNEMHFTEKNSNTRDQVWKTNEAIGIDNKTSKTITESNVEQIATKICVDNERDNGEHQRHIAKIENIDTKEQDTITVEENDDKLSSGIRDGASCSPRDSNIAVTNQVLTTSNDPNQLDNESDSTSAKDINAEEATRIQMAHTVNIVEPGSIETANVTDDIVLPNATIESDKSLTKEETLNIVSAMTVDNQNGRIETNMNLNVDEDKQLVAESFVDSKAASNETNNNNITTASGIHTKEIVFCCSAEAKITSTKLDTTNDGNDLETESRDIANLYKKEENTEDEFKVDDANTCPDTPTRTNQEEEEDVDEQKMEEEQELHRNYSKNIESKTDVETIEGDAIEIDSKIPTTFES